MFWCAAGQSITHKDADDCRALLEAFDWNLEAALAMVLEDEQSRASSASSASTAARSRRDIDGVQDELRAARTVSAARQQPPLRRPAILDRPQLMATGPAIVRWPVNITWSIFVAVGALA